MDKKFENLDNKKEEERIIEYSLNVSIITRLLKEKLINEKEYDIIKKRVKSI